MNPYAAPHEDELLHWHEAERLVNEMLDDGAGVGSIAFRLNKNGIPRDHARELATSIKERRHREENTAKRYGNILGFATCGLIAWIALAAIAEFMLR